MLFSQGLLNSLVLGLADLAKKELEEASIRLLRDMCYVTNET